MSGEARKAKREELRRLTKALRGVDAKEVEDLVRQVRGLEQALRVQYLKIDAKDGDVVAVHGTDAPPEIIDRVCADLVKFLRARGRRVLVMNVPSAEAIEHLPADAMRRHGWVRAGSPEAVENELQAQLAAARAARRAEIEASAGEPTAAVTESDAAPDSRTDAPGPSDRGGA